MGSTPARPCRFISSISKSDLGAVAEISATVDDQPLAVRLSPCGKATARFIDPSGKPLAQFRPMIQIVVTPGVPRADLKRARTGLAADAEFVANFDREHYWHGPVTDENGGCTFPALIAGATYRLLTKDKLDQWEEKDFSVHSGETLQLGDIVVAPGS